MGDIKMSARGRKRLEMLSRVKKDALITQAKGSELSGIGYRHTRRVCERYGEEGDRGPIRGNRGRPSSRRMEEKSQEDDRQGEAIGQELKTMKKTGGAYAEFPGDPITLPRSARNTSSSVFFHPSTRLNSVGRIVG